MPMLKIRKFRRRWVLTVFLIGSLIFLLSKTLSNKQDLVNEQYEIKRTFLRQPFEWQPKIPDLPEANSSRQWICRNSVQGKQLIVDERGYVCEREHVVGGGCCDSKHARTSKHSCDTCEKNGCCERYEYCVSCCLRPEKKPLMQKILKEGREALDKLFASVDNLFELCLSKCRTSSLSVQHENSYRNSDTKHCYGENPPDLQASVPV
ncbi:SREBP regulating gene protein-like [Ylistrum balloti]|uniref:SREBP regulating gene protein-like n=1 Tax=Ylistrum balloti TaxID=509963 RepID=UPI002905E602|nr:SREBP regulating gene protein-like [Ylistrum balloti]